MNSDEAARIRIDSGGDQRVSHVACHRSVRLYADCVGQRWVVLDAGGEFWELPLGDNAWEQRQPFAPSDDAELEPIPGHYKQFLGLPF